MSRKETAPVLKKPVIPNQRGETVRQEILSILKSSGSHTAASLSKAVGRSQKEIYDHLGHLKKSGSILVEPAECRKCGFTFEDRKKVKKPSKCPKCKSSYINAPSFTVK